MRIPSALPSPMVPNTRTRLPCGCSPDGRPHQGSARTTENGTRDRRSSCHQIRCRVARTHVCSPTLLAISFALPSSSAALGGGRAPPLERRGRSTGKVRTTRDAVRLKRADKKTARGCCEHHARFRTCSNNRSTTANLQLRGRSPVCMTRAASARAGNMQYKSPANLEPSATGNYWYA